MSFKDDPDETLAEKQRRERKEGPQNKDRLWITYCPTCACHYSNGCVEHLNDQIPLVKSTNDEE